MAYPLNVKTRLVSFGGAATVEAGIPLHIRISTESSRSLIWVEDGYRLESLAALYMSATDGQEIVFEVPTTDQNGWLDAATRQAIIVDPGEASHLYTTKLEIFTEDHELIRTYEIGPYAVPEGPGTLDADLLNPNYDPIEGTLTVYIPGPEGGLSEAGQKAAADAVQAAVDAEGYRDEAEEWRDQAEAFAGNNVAFQDGAMAQVLGDEESASRGVIGAISVVKAGEDNGGQVPDVMRVPTLTPHFMFPNERDDYQAVWGDGLHAFFVSRDKGLHETFNAGKDYANRNRPMGGAYVGFKGCFVKTPTGRYVGLRNDGTFAAPEIKAVYSDDSGSTWTVGGTFPVGTQPLGSQSLCVDGTTGFLYYVEYAITGPDDRPEISVWRSEDDGEDWGQFHIFSGRTTSDPNRVRHLHACQYDPYSQRVYVTAGDGEAAAGIYRVNDAGDGLEPVLLNSQVGNLRACVIGLMFFDDYIVWGTDNSSDSALYRMSRNQIGEPTPQIEYLYRLNGSAWWTIRARDDHSVWIVSTSNEVASPGAPLDSSSHMYAISDQGQTVWELGTLGDGMTTPVAVQPLGDGGNHFWLASRFFGANFSGMFSLDRSGGAAIPLEPKYLPLTINTLTANSGMRTLGDGEVYTFGHAVVPHGLTRFYAEDFGVYRKTGAAARVQAVRASDGKVVAFVTSQSHSFKNGTGRAGQRYVGQEELVPGEVILFQLVNTGTSSEATAYVSYGFGTSRAATTGDYSHDMYV